MNVYYLLGAALLLLLVLIFKAIADQEVRDREFTESLKKSYGKASERSYDPIEFELISHYFRNKVQGQYVIDDITWNDLDMDNFFLAINTAQSQLGEEYLYDLLRRPLLSGDESERTLKERGRVAAFFGENEEIRLLFQKAFHEMGRTKKYSLSDYLLLINEVKREGNMLHIFCIAFGLFAISMIFYSPPLGFLLILLATAFNIGSYFKRKGEIAPYISCFIYLIRLVRESAPLLKTGVPELSVYQELILGYIRRLKPLCSNAWLVMSGRRLTGSLLELPMDYLRIFFHLDLIKFNNMLSVIEKEKKSIEGLIDTIGLLDSMIAVSSFRASLSEWCEPEFLKQQGAYFEAERLFHPLLKEPVPYSIKTGRGVLVTGSNASGKSTFLKSIALSALLAETVYTVSAASCALTMAAVYSSMSLRDDILVGKSYYMAEIKALKRIMDAVKGAGGQSSGIGADHKEDGREGIKVFCFVDEVLKGTNTVERIAAGSQLLKSLSRPEALCFAATHDIELTHILEEHYVNYHFDETIADGRISFSYELLPGRAQSRDAIFLLSVMGYDKEITDAAFAQSDAFLSTGQWGKI